MRVTDPEVFLVDVCGTLVRDDTTVGLLHHHISRISPRSLRLALFSALSSRRSPLWWCFAGLEAVLRRHLLKHVLVRLLEGDAVSELQESARGYASHLLGFRRVRPVWAVIEPALGTQRLFLASASLEPIVESLASMLRAPYVASTLESRDGVLTGRYLEDLTGGKREALERKFGSETFQGPLCVISDNVSDRPILESAARRYVVLNRRSDRRKWRGLDAACLKVDE